jgi:preprotein translocase subunit YajC|tara:strand:+ start:1592 stop:1972 length:381 start_codon:yes stop_codon:yes gene_type:complete
MLTTKVSALLLRLKMILNPTEMIMIAQAPAPAQSGGFEMFVPMILMIVIFYFLLIRPQTKREKERKKMVGALKSGDSVVTRGGVIGTVQSVKADTVTIRSLESKFELEKYSVERQITDKSELKDNK